MPNQHVDGGVFVFPSTHAPSTIATGLAQRPQEWPGPNEEDAFVRNWTVPCTIGLVLYPQNYKITVQAVEATVSFHNPMINTD